MSKAAARFVRSFINRNPRNPEVSAFRLKPRGFEFETDRAQRSFIYRVDLVENSSHQEATITHHTDGVVLRASTREPAIRSQLYSAADTAAAMNIGRVIADRALKSGIVRVSPGLAEHSSSSHQKAFYEALASTGLELREIDAPEHSYEVNRRMTWQRFPVHHNRSDKLDEDYK